MFRSGIAAFLVLLSCAIAASSRASAAFVSPCPSGAVVKIVGIGYPEEPTDPEVSILKQQSLDLGYRFTGCFSGEWVGDPAFGGKPVELSPEQLATLLELAGLKALPPAPSYFAAAHGDRINRIWLLVGSIALGTILLHLLSALFKKLAGPTGVLASTLLPDEVADPSAAVAPPPTAFKTAYAAVERAASQHVRVPVAGSVTPRSHTHEDIGKAAFGRR